MQLINDLSDLPRFASLLRPEYREKLTNDINGLLVKYMDEQAKNVIIETPKKNDIDINFDDLIPKNNVNLSENKPPVPMSAPPPPAVKPIENLYKNNLTNLNKPNFPPPPPPLPQNAGSFNPPKLKPSSLLQRPGMAIPTQKIAPTKFISIFDSLGYIMPELTEEGKLNAQNLTINTEPSKFLRLVDGSTTLKQVYMINYPSTVSPLQFIERSMLINQDKNMTFRVAGDVLPQDTDILFRLGDLLIGFGLIDEKTLENALMFQRRDTRNVQGDDEFAGYDAAESRKEDNKNLRKEKPLLGDILVDMKVVSQQQVEHLLRIQKWFRDLIEKVR